MHAFSVARICSAALFSCLLVATGCTSSGDSPDTPETGDSPVTQPSSSPSASSTTPTPTASSPPEATPLTDRLLPTGEVPGLNAGWRWQDGDTGEPTSEPFGFCAQSAPGADLLSIGATDVVQRTYFPADDSDDNASEQVAEFPDARTANTAWSVLAAWHKRCGRTISADIGLRVRPFVSVPVTAGSARWYLLSWQPAGEETGRFEAFGMVLSGTRIAVLRMDNGGQDYDYPAGQEPMVGMVRGAAGWLD